MFDNIDFDYYEVGEEYHNELWYGDDFSYDEYFDEHSTWRSIFFSFEKKY